MGVFTRPDSPWYWLWLETAPPGLRKEKTRIKIGRTTTQRHDSRLLAEDLYHQRMNQIAARVHRMPVALPAIRFRAYAAVYVRDVIAHQRGAERARELVKALVNGFGDELLSTVDRERVQRYMTARRGTASANTVNREIDTLKVMLRDAAPKYLDVLANRRHEAPGGREAEAPADDLYGGAEAARRDVAARGPPRPPDARAAHHRRRQPGALDGPPRLEAQRSPRPLDLSRRSETGEPCEVALSVRGARALDQIPNSGEYYFQGFRGAKVERDRRARVNHLLKRLCTLAGVPYGRKQGGITFHWATRRTGATRMLINKRVPLPAVQRQGTWKNPDVLLQIYAEADRQSLLDAVAPMPVRSRARRKRA